MECRRDAGIRSGHHITAEYIYLNPKMWASDDVDATAHRVTFGPKDDLVRGQAAGVILMWFAVHIPPTHLEPPRRDRRP